MPEVVLVRHAMPEVRRDIPAERWQLGDEGRAAARVLARALPLAPFTLTSDEPKARQTAEELVAVRGGELCVDARVAETRRPHVWDPEFAGLARAYVGGHHHDGWEAHDSVAARFDAAVRAGIRASQEAPLVIVNHGQALTLWLRSVGAIEDAARFWSALAFPDAWKLGVHWSSGALVADTLVRLGGGSHVGTT